jgi:hypothetical protein
MNGGGQIGSSGGKGMARVEHEPSFRKSGGSDRLHGDVGGSDSEVGVQALIPRQFEH